MRKSVRAIIEKWAQQAWLPGMEAEEEAERDRFPEQTKSEEAIDIQQQKEDHPRVRYEGWTQMPFRGEMGVGGPMPETDSEELQRYRDMKPTGEYRLPHPSKFPELDINTIGMMFHVKEDGEAFFAKKKAEIERRFPPEEAKRRIAEIRDLLEDVWWVPAEIALKIYNKFREVYTKYYDAYLAAGKLYGGIRNREEMEAELQDLPIKNFLLAVPDYLINEIKIGVGRIFKNTNLQRLSPFYRRAKLNPAAMQDTINELTIAINKYDSGIDLIEKLNTSIKKQMWEWIETPGKLQSANFVEKKYPGANRQIIQSILDKTRRGDGNWTPDRVGRWVHSIMKNFNSPEATQKGIGQIITDPLEENIRTQTEMLHVVFSTKFKKYRNELASEIQKEIDEAIGGWEANSVPVAESVNGQLVPMDRELDKAYEGVKKILAPYFDLNKLERAFNFGVFSKEDKITPKMKLAFKALIVRNVKTQGFYYEAVHNNIYPKIGNVLNEFKSVEGATNHLDKLARVEAKKVMSEVIPGLAEALDGESRLQAGELKNTSFEGIKFFTQAGDFSPKAVVDNFVKVVSKEGFPEEPFRTAAKLAMKSGGYSKLAEIKFNRPIQKPYYVLFKVLQKNNKLSPEKILKVINMTDDLYADLHNIIYRLPSGVKSPLDVLAGGIRSLDTIDADIKNLTDVISSVHNNANNITTSTLKRLLAHKNIVFTNSRDIAKKFNDLIVKILGQGGVKAFNKKYAEIIRLTPERGIVKPDFRKRLAQVARIFLDNKEINPAKPNFQEVKRLVLDTASEINLIMKYKDFAKYYEQAKPKDQNLFKLDMDLSPKLRFRVLKDLDPYHFQVGDDTDCCQSPGGVGSEAMVDSFINPLAGVLVLETLDGGDWDTVAQSYFHWVPEDKGYILDNVEVNPAYDEDNFQITTRVEPVDYDSIQFGSLPEDVSLNLSIEQLYAIWAREKKKELGLPEEKGKGYILAGRGYSDINTGSFRQISLDSDPREFEVDDPYTDWDEDRSMDLTNPTIEIPQSYPEQKTAGIYDYIYKLAVDFQENLKEYLDQNPHQYQTMQGIEEESFEKYRDIYDFDQDAEDIEDDFTQPGAMGVGVTDSDGTMAGYVYGYNMTADEMPEIDFNLSNQELAQQYGIKFYAGAQDGFAQQIHQLVNAGKVFYVANLALPKYKVKLARMIKDLLDKLRQGGYQYVTFDALSDTMKLFLGDGRIPKAARMAMFGVELVAMIPDEGGWEHAQAILKI